MEPVSELFQIDDDGHLFISPVISDWTVLSSRGIDTVIDLEGGLDQGVPQTPDEWLYIYFPILDDNLPNERKLRCLTMMGANLIRSGHRVLSHCSMGFNRSAFVAGLILYELGMPGPAVVERLRERRPGALFNEKFADHLLGLPDPPRRA